MLKVEAVNNSSNTVVWNPGKIAHGLQIRTRKTTPSCSFVLALKKAGTHWPREEQLRFWKHDCKYTAGHDASSELRAPGGMLIAFLILMGSNTTVTGVRFLTLVLFLMANFPRQALSEVHLPETAGATAMPAVQYERDPLDEEDCFRLGQLNISFRTSNGGPPAIGIVLTDPRRRRIGFDPLTKHAWEELPGAAGFINCDASDGKQICGGIVQVCGPLSGAYRLEVIGRETSHYAINISARSAQIGYGKNLRSSISRHALSNIPVREGSREIISINYSRDPALPVAARLKKLPDEQENTFLHSTNYRSSKPRQGRMIIPATGN